MLEDVEALGQQVPAGSPAAAGNAARCRRCPRSARRHPRRGRPWRSRRRARGSGSVVPGLTSSMAIIAPRPRMSPIDVVPGLHGAKPLHHGRLDGLAAPARSSSRMVRWRRARRRRRPGCRRRCRRGRPECTASMISARPVTAASGSPPAMPLAVVIRSGTTPSWSQANQAPVRQKPVWISSAISSAPLAVHQAAMAGRKPVGRDDEAALALDRLDQHGGHVRGADLGGDDVDAPGRRPAAPVRPPSRYG